MAIFVNEKKMVENNIFQYEEKLKSPMARFLDTTPTFVTYYHINADETTTDAENVNTAFNNIATKVVDGVEYTVWGWSDPVNKNTVAKDKFLVCTCGKDEDDVKSYTIKVKK